MGTSARPSGVEGESLTVGGYVFTCEKGPCSVTLNADETLLTVQGTITVATPMPEPPPPPPPTPPVALDLEIPAGYEPAAGVYVVPAGTFSGSNGVWFSCEAGGEDCIVTVHADGKITADGDGGTVDGFGLTDSAQAALDKKNKADQDAKDKMDRATAQQSDIDDAVTAANTALAAVADPATLRPKG